MIEAVCGDGAKGDIAVDDISMVARNCSEVNNGNYLRFNSIIINRLLPNLKLLKKINFPRPS